MAIYLREKIDPKKTFDSWKASNAFSAPLNTGVSDFLEFKKVKEYEFAEKPNYVNPFATLNSGNGSSDQDTAPSPTKKDTIVRRHTDNYGTKSIVDDDFKTYLTPCRWQKTGWKYEKKEFNYFDKTLKALNTVDISQNTLDSTKKKKGYYTTQNMKTYKSQSGKSLNDVVEKGIPNHANYVSECYPTIPCGDDFAKKYNREIHDAKQRKNISNEINTVNKPISRHLSQHKRHYSNNIRFGQNLGKKSREVKGRNHQRRHRRERSYAGNPQNIQLVKELAPNNTDCGFKLANSPGLIHQLSKMEKNKLKKSLYKIRATRKDSDDKSGNFNNTISSFANKSVGKRQFDGNRTFYSGVVDKALTLTLGGAFPHQKKRTEKSDSVVWGGNVFYGRGKSFNRKRTFITEWQSAVNNSGVFVNK